MNYLLNKVFLNRKDSVYVEKQEDNIPEDYKKALITTASKNLESLGYKMSKDLVAELLDTSADEIVHAVTFITDTIKNRLGGSVEYHPMYPGFPDSVMERTEVELYFDALIYAISDFTILPFDTESERKIKELELGFTKLKTIELADINTPKEIASNLMSSQIAFPQDDKNDLMTILGHYTDIRELLPQKIPNKENLTWLVCEYMDKMEPSKNPFMKYLNSATDILRIAAVRSGYDSSLTDEIKFKKPSRPEVRLYANYLLKMKDTESEMYKHTQLFKKLSEVCYFRTIKNPKLQTLLDKLYNKDIERSFMSKRDALIKQNDYMKLVSLYKEAPGQMGADLARLSLMAQKQPNYYLAKAQLCTELRKNVKKMSTLNLLKVESLLQTRTEKNEFTVYSPKKGLSNPYMKVDEREPLRKDLVENLTNIIKEQLQERYEKKRPLGKVYIDEALKDIKIPSQQRANSKGSTGMSFGSKFDIKGIDYLRSFIWWTNSEKTHYVDIDLSAAIYDKDLNKITDISYYNLKGSGLGVHSGDIRNGGPVGGKGAAEFIDLDLKELKKPIRERNPAYVMFSVRIYDGDNFADTPCKFGWMQSDHQPEKLFDITKVEKAIDLNTESRRAIPVLFDIENNKMIWMDRNPREMADFSIKNLNAIIGGNNNLTYTSSDMVEAYRAIHTTTPNLYSLFQIHAITRGEIVDDPKEADTLFTVERVGKEEYPNGKEFVCAYDNDEIVGDLISDELSTKDIDFYKNLEQERECHIAEAIAIHEADEIEI